MRIIKMYDIDELYEERWKALVRWLYAEREKCHGAIWSDPRAQDRGFMCYHVLVEMGRIEKETRFSRITSA